MSPRIPKSVTIADGASLSDALDLGENYAPTSIVLPSGWDAAAVTFAVSQDGTTYVPLFDQTTGGEYTLTSVTVAALSRGIPIDPLLFLGFSKMKVRSGTNASPVNQSGAAVVGVMVREFA